MLFAYTENFDKYNFELNLEISKIMLRIGNVLGALYFPKRAKEVDPDNKELNEMMNLLNMPFHY